MFMRKDATKISVISHMSHSLCHIAYVAWSTYVLAAWTNDVRVKVAQIIYENRVSMAL